MTELLFSWRNTSGETGAISWWETSKRFLLGEFGEKAGPGLKGVTSIRVGVGEKSEPFMRIGVVSCVLLGNGDDTWVVL